MTNYLIDEKNIVRRAQRDPEAFGEIYDFYYARIFRFVLHRTGNIEVAKDITSETFFQALKNLWRFKFMSRPFSAWLYKIAVTQVAMYFRERKKYFPVSFEESPDVIKSQIRGETTEEKNFKIDIFRDFQKIHTIILKLKEAEQNVIVLRYLEAKSIKEISQILKMKINTVKSHIRRGLMRLRCLFENNNVVNYGDVSRRIKTNQEAFEKK